jgi:dolichol-phosphate mannosyltransferase
MAILNSRFSLVIPTYNETDSISELCERLVKSLSGRGIEFEIIIVDDNSPDQTWKLVQKISEKDNRIKLIRRLNEKGLGTAVIAGWRNAKGDILGVMDGDLQQPPEALPLLLDKLAVDPAVDIAVASRNIEGGSAPRRSAWRKLISSSGEKISRLLLPRLTAQVSDPMSGFFVMRRRVIENKHLAPLGYKIFLEVLAKGSYGKIVEVPYVFSRRRKGGSKAGIKQYIISLIHLLKLSLRKR